jgi:hypothetical protein
MSGKSGIQAILRETIKEILNQKEQKTHNLKRPEIHDIIGRIVHFDNIISIDTGARSSNDNRPPASVWQDQQVPEPISPAGLEQDEQDAEQSSCPAFVAEEDQQLPEQTVVEDESMSVDLPVLAPQQQPVVSRKKLGMLINAHRRLVKKLKSASDGSAPDDDWISEQLDILTEAHSDLVDMF